MAKYEVCLTTTASTIVTVEAEDEAEAIDLALTEGGPGVCAQCAGWGRSSSNSGIELGDWDFPGSDQDQSDWVWIAQK